MDDDDLIELCDDICNGEPVSFWRWLLFGYWLFS